MFFKGLVINNADEINARRVQVRVLSVHPMEGEVDYNLVPDECLPWARPAVPITAGKNTGSTGEFDVPDLGDWVWLFFEDDEYQRPVYFASIVSDMDVNSSFSPGNNKISNDKWGNTIFRDANSIKIIKNNGSIVELNDNGINIVTHDGNIVNLSDKDKNITIKDVNGNIINTTEKNIICKNKNGKGFDVAGDVINLVSGDKREPAVYGIKLLEWLSSHTHTSSFPTSPTSPPLADQLPKLEEILHSNTLYSDGSPYEVSAEDKNIVEEREGEEVVVYGSYVDQSTNDDYVNEVSTSEKISKEDALKKYTEFEKKQQEAFAMLQDLPDLAPSVTEDQFNRKYPVLNDPFDGDEVAERMFNNKLKEFVSPLQDLLRKARMRYRFVITEGFRTAEYQNKLYKRGLTPCDGYNRKSKHQGNGSIPISCVDISPRPGGTGNTTAVRQLNEVMMNLARFNNIRLKWLGNVVMPNGRRDTPHYELF